jgi:quinol monooxygenase YgiN
MSLPALIGFAGVLVAAVATGMLAGRCFRQPRVDFILWTAAALGLTVALAAQSMGFARGFNQVTFRAVQLPALLLVPLLLAWGLVELVAGSEAVRFGMRLMSSALIAVASVILATDPLTAQPFSKAWPSGSAHFQPVAHYALNVVQAVAVLTAAAAAALAAARARTDPRWRPALTGIAPVGLAVVMTVGLRVIWPDRSAYPLVSLLAAALVWFGATRIAATPGRDRRPATDHGADYSDGADGDAGPQHAVYDQPGSRDPRGPQRPVTSRAPDRPERRDPPQRPQRLDQPERFRGPRTRMLPVGDRPQDTQPGPGSAAMAGADPEFGHRPKAAGSPAAAAARPYGRILIFTLLEERVADFDRLAEQTAEEVRTREPGTLVYVIHLVPNAPMQRIFYEIYRDRDAFGTHESQPYMKRFVTDRRSCVLATNVIELRLKYAKVAPLPNSQPAGPPPPQSPPQTAPPPASAPSGTRAQLPSAGRRYGGG